MSGRKSRNKGANEERSVVNLHRSIGIECKRTLESGARSDGSATFDIDIYPHGIDNAAIIGECKCRESIGDYLWDWLGENDFVTLRKNRKDRLYLIPERMWLDLLKSFSTHRNDV